jgi:ABC-2 type transport system permease protein
VIDNAGLFADKTALDAALTGYAVDIVTQEQEGKIIDRTKTDSKISLAVVQISGGAVSYDYYVKSEGNGPSPDMLSAVFKSIYSAQLLSENGVKSSVITSVLGSVTYRVHQAGKGMMSGYIPAILVSLLLFMCIYMYGYWVAMSIASEKTSRVMELLITSTRPSKIVIGKSIAMGLLGLLQLLIVIAASVTTYKIAYPKDFNIGGLTINFSGFTPYYAVMIIIYFVLGFALYAMISAVAGATVSNAEDIRTAIMPVSMVAVIAFYFAYGTIMVPESTAAVAASIIPFSAPFSMPSRILMTEVPVWQMAVSIGLLAVTTVLMAWVSIRLYSSAVLHYGRKLKISELIAMSKH